MKKLIFGLFVGLVVLAIFNASFAEAATAKKDYKRPIIPVPSVTSKSGSNSDAVFSAAFIKARENTFKELKQSVWKFSAHSTAKAKDITGTNSAMYNMNWK